jgi:hypothetical protein
LHADCDLALSQLQPRPGVHGANELLADGLPQSLRANSRVERSQVKSKTQNTYKQRSRDAGKRRRVFITQ